MSERDIYMSDIKDVFEKLRYLSYDDLSDEDKNILTLAFRPSYSNVEIRYMLEGVGKKRQSIFTENEVKKMMDKGIPRFK